MRNKNLPVLVMLLVISVDVSCGWEEKVYAAAENAKDNTITWTNWVFNKFSGGTQGGDDAENIALYIKENVDASLSDATNYASEQGGDAMNTAHDKAGSAEDFTNEKLDQIIRLATEKGSGARESANNAYDEAKQGLKRAGDATYEEASHIKESLPEAMQHTKDIAGDAYDEAKQNMGGASNFASDKASHARDTIDGSTKYGKDRVNDAKEPMAEATKYMRDKLIRAYEEARNRIAKTVDKGSVGQRTKSGKDKAGDAYETVSSIASNKADKTKGAIRDSLKYGKERVGGIYNKVSNAKEEINNDEIREKVKKVTDLASTKAKDAKKTMYETSMSMKDRFARAYAETKEQTVGSSEDGKLRTGRVLNIAKFSLEHMFDDAKKKVTDSFEDAKKKASNAMQDTKTGKD